ncbi:MAG: T9SS type A sorting domain-containing protein [Bacteroidetes bacterium]|nr:T9SS type A sorting domain-containing protein [Bacteroidota bacterium]
MYELNDSNTWSVVAAPGYNWLDTIGGYGYGVPGLFDRAGRLWITEGSDNFYFCAAGVYSFTPFNSIQGRVFYDTNGNGIADAGEHGFTAANIVQSTNGYYSNTDTAGRYAVVYIDSAISHTITAAVPPYYHLTTPASYTVAPTDSACCHDFGVRADGNIQDLRISAVSSTAIVGYPTVIWLDYQNVGTLTMSDTITYTYDTTLRYTTAWPAPSVVSGHTLSWSYQALAPLSTRGIMIEFALDPDPTLTGDTLLSTATIGPLVSDSTPADNAYLHQQIVTSAFDPNLKTVSPADGIAPGKNLTYTIHFQNTGTAPAINIVVYDTLDANLDPATFKLLGSSHPVSVLLTGKGILIFTFSNIQLPDSAADQAASNGFVQFSISVSAPLHQPTATIANTASIVFDFNPPVQTNTAVASFYPAGIVTLPAGDRGQLQVMPNPAINSITISTTGDARDGMISLYDVTGKALWQTIVIGKYTTLDLQGFAAGIYMIRMHYPDGRTASCRLVKL